MVRSAEERFNSKVERSTAGCWLWRAARNPKGYGQFYVSRGRRTTAHRFAYELAHGSVPDGLEVDHLCRNRACVNPAHLEAVDHRTNLLRGRTIPAGNRVKTHCPQGHCYDNANTIVDPAGRRSCRTCKRRRDMLGARARRARSAA